LRENDDRAAAAMQFDANLVKDLFSERDWPPPMEEEPKNGEPKK
jgi:hypothetical protein